MREEGLLYDVQSGGFLHVYRDGGKLIIDGQPCEHEHSMPMVVLAE
jgi:hypothetical protein